MFQTAFRPWIEHQFLNGIRDSRKAGSLRGMMRGVRGVRKSIDQSWLAKGLGLVTKVINTLTQEDFHGALQKLFERYKCIAAGRDYFEGDLSSMCVLSIKVPIRKKAGNLFNDPRTVVGN